MRAPSFRAILVLSAVFMCVIPATAQFRAGIQGTVQDKSGAVISGATVTATNDETGRAVTAQTSESGFYRISALPPGNYTMKVEAKGFKTAGAKLAVPAEAIQGFNANLEPGQVTETVTVTEIAEALETETANMSGTLTAQQIQNLPKTGRDPYELLRLAPGVFGDGARSGIGQSIQLPNNAGPNGSNQSIVQVENQVQVSANGQRVSANNFEIDGVNVNSLTWGGAATLTPNEESVKQVQVTSSTYSAEDGRNSGAQVKVVSQNGTNAFHGSLFFKYNDPGLNAYNDFTVIAGDTIQNSLVCNKGTGSEFTLFNVTRCPDRVTNKFRNYGGSLGGPILRDRLFFFFSVEALKNDAVKTVTKNVETPEFRQAIGQLRSGTVTAAVVAAPGTEPRIESLLTPDCSNFTNQGRPCQVIGNALDIGSITGAYGEYVSLGNPGGGGLDGIPDLLLAQLAVPSSLEGQQYNGRVDFHAGQNQFAGSFYLTRQNSVNGDDTAQGRPIADLNFKPVSPSIFLSWIRPISPTMLNEARVNFNRFAFNQVESNSSVNFGIPRVEIEGLPIADGDRIRFGSPRSEAQPAVFAQNTYAFRDVLTKQLSKMVLKGGFEYRAEQDNNNLLGGARPLYSFVGLFNFANGTPIFESINVDPRTGQPADARRYFRTKDYGVFFQNDWKLRPNFTLNAGLRYEYFTPLREANGQLVNLVLGNNGILDGQLEITDQLTEPDRNNFAPRIGFAWSPYRSNSDVVVRGGFGVSYNRIPDVLFANTRGNPPFFARFNLCCGTAATDFGTPFNNGNIQFVQGSSNSVNSYPANPALSAGIDPTTGIPINGKVEIWGAQQNFPVAYVYNYSLETQMMVPAGMVATIGYAGSSSHKLIRIVQQEFLLDGPNTSQFQPVFFPTPDVTAHYHSLNTRIARNFKNGFTVDAKYRFSKSIDQLSNEGPGAQTNQTFPRNLALENGPSDYDATHFVVISGVWELPIFRGRKDALGIALGGWQISGIFTAHSGFPWTPVTRRQALLFPGGQTLSPIRPIAFFGTPGNDASTDAFLRENGNFPGGGEAFFDISATGTPAIGRNSFRGPRYSSVDFSFVKNTPLPLGGERGNLEFRANMFNAFNKLNLAPFGFATGSTTIEDSHFGQATTALAGRVLEFQARLRF